MGVSISSLGMLWQDGLLIYLPFIPFFHRKYVYFFLRTTAISLRVQSSPTFLSSKTNSTSITLRKWWQCFKNSKWSTLRSRSQALSSSWTTIWPSAQQSSKQLKMLNSTMLYWTISHTIKSKSPSVSRKHKQQQLLSEITQSVKNHHLIQIVSVSIQKMHNGIYEWVNEGEEGE